MGNSVCDKTVLPDLEDFLNAKPPAKILNQLKMKKNNPLLKRTSSRIYDTGICLSLILFLQTLVLTSTAQTQNYQQTLIKRSRNAYDYSDTVKRWLDWNILFPKNATDQDKDNYINKLETDINQYISTDNSHTGNNFSVDYHVVYCPCDSLLTNLNATKALGASGSATPPTPPRTGGSGDTVSLNMTMYPDTLIQDGKYVYNVIEKKVPLTIFNVDKKKILAVMDTGLDPHLFGTGFNKLLWTDPKSKITLRNFQFYHNNRPLDYMLDDDAHVHGTAVISVALQEFESVAGINNPKPQIMILKVLDERGQGNTFSVSCGLSYAIQKKATLVNASLGYYSQGHPDSILLHYVRLCNDAQPASIPILAAAGNTPGKHFRGFLCNPAPKTNELTSTKTFDPASFSKQLPNVISVTTLQNATKACFYQNYSNDYVNVGVANGSGASCCKFAVPFLPFGYEGSSFATPFISGKMMACLMEGRTPQSCREQWSTAPVGSPTVTKDGKFVPNP